MDAGHPDGEDQGGVTITIACDGLRIDRETGQVLNVHFHKIPGLYCAGEMVGAGCSISTTRAAPDWCRTPCSAASRDAARQRPRNEECGADAESDLVPLSYFSSPSTACTILHTILSLPAAADDRFVMSHSKSEG